MTWPSTKLGDVVEFLDHWRKPITANDRVPGPVPYYGANGQQDSVATALFDEPLVLLAEDGGHFDEPEKGVAYRIDGPSWVNNHAHVLRPRDNLDIGYLTRVLENYDLTPYVSGTTRGKLTKGRAGEIEIPLPPLPEQRRIASILDQADQLRARRRRAIMLLEQVEDTALGDLLRAGLGNETVTLSEIADIQTGPFGSLLHREDYVSGGIPLVNPMHIRNGRIYPDPEFSVTESKFAELDSFELRKGDVVLGRRGEMGRAAEVVDSHGRLLCGTGCMILRPRDGRVLGVVLVGLLSSPSVRTMLEQRAQGVTMLNLNQSIVGNLEVPLASVESQLAFAGLRGHLRALREHQASHLAKLDDLFASLQHRAFRGEL